MLHGRRLTVTALVGQDDQLLLVEGPGGWTLPSTDPAVDEPLADALGRCLGEVTGLPSPGAELAGVAEVMTGAAHRLQFVYRLQAAARPLGPRARWLPAAQAADQLPAAWLTPAAPRYCLLADTAQTDGAAAQHAAAPQGLPSAAAGRAANGSPVHYLVASAIVQDGERVLSVCNQWPLGAAWGLPGGRVEPGETLARAAAREVAEETGLLVEPTDLAYVLDNWDPVRGNRFLHFVFAADVVGGRLARPAADEFVTDVAWVPTAAIAELYQWPTYHQPLLAWLAGRADAYYLCRTARWKG